MKSKINLVVNWWVVSQTQTATIFLRFKTVFQKEMNLTLKNQEIWYKFLSFLPVKKEKKKKKGRKRKREGGRKNARKEGSRANICHSRIMAAP